MFCQPVESRGDHAQLVITDSQAVELLRLWGGTLSPKT